MMLPLLDTTYPNRTDVMNTSKSPGAERYEMKNVEQSVDVRRIAKTGLSAAFSIDCWIIPLNISSSANALSGSISKANINDSSPDGLTSFHSRYPIPTPAVIQSICTCGLLKISPTSSSDSLRRAIKTSDPARIEIVTAIRYPSYVITPIGIKSVIMRYTGMRVII